MAPVGSYDAIMVGAGHNGLVAACYLARAGLKMLVLERQPYIGGAAVSRRLYRDFTYSNCSYVCSLLRPEIIRTLELPRFGLQLIPYEGGCTMMRDGGHLALYDNHDALRREIARHSKRDAEAYERYSRDVMRQCKFIKPLLMREPPDPTSFKPRDILELLHLGSGFIASGEHRMYDTLRFWTMSAADFLDEYFESEIVKAHFAGSSIIGTALGPRSPGTAYVLLHHYMGDIDDTVGRLGIRARRHGRHQQGARRLVRRRAAGPFAAPRRWPDPGAERARRAAWRLTSGEEIRATLVISNLDVRRTFLKTMDPKDLPDEFLRPGAEFQDPRIVRQAQHRARRAAALSGHTGGRAVHARRHARHRHDRDDGARVRRLEGRPLVARAVHRHADPLADRSDHGSQRQALHVGVRAVLSLRTRRRGVDGGEAPAPSATRSSTPSRSTARISRI